MGMTVVARGTHHGFAVHHGLVVGLLRTPMNAEIAGELRRVLEAEQRAGHFIAYLHLAELTDLKGSDSSEVRRQYVGLLARFQDLDGAVAMIVGNDGFVGAAVRAAFTGVVVVARPRIPLMAFASVGEGAAWLSREAQKRGHALAESDFEEGARLLRAAL